MNSVIITSLNNKPTGILTYEHDAFIYACLSCFNEYIISVFKIVVLIIDMHMFQPVYSLTTLLVLMATARRTS